MSFIPQASAQGRILTKEQLARQSLQDAVQLQRLGDHAKHQMSLELPDINSRIKVLQDRFETFTYRLNHPHNYVNLYSTELCTIANVIETYTIESEKLYHQLIELSKRRYTLQQAVICLEAQLNNQLTDSQLTHNAKLDCLADSVKDPSIYWDEKRKQCRRQRFFGLLSQNHCPTNLFDQEK
jgi:hypothetical protein